MLVALKKVPLLSPKYPAAMKRQNRKAMAVYYPIF